VEVEVDLAMEDVVSGDGIIPLKVEDVMSSVTMEGGIIRIHAIAVLGEQAAVAKVCYDLIIMISVFHHYCNNCKA
jgi:hypothetical protein